ncbi:MAG: alcohol dehydrogenase catalytic domain-containing protein, partial [Myxococcales bacterium]|nr:alcohol dehydrogenase catalytic domain-containing protein [Myxococcales bacterium]
MRIRLQAPGWDRDLAVEAGDAPAPTGRQVTVAIEACGVCHRDLIDRAGRFPFMQVPITPGHEAVGRITAVGPDVTLWRVGDRVASMHRDSCGACPACEAGETSLCLRAAAVLGLLVDGGYATTMTVPERALYRVPDDLDAAQAAVLHCTFGTAYRGLTRGGRLAPGMRVLVTGGNGGVGAAAIQIATRLGATVIAQVRRADHVAMVEGLGATAVIVDGDGRFHKRLPGGLVDVALDCVGAPTFNAALRSLNVGGRMVAIGNVVEERVELNLGWIITRGVQITGSSGATAEEMAAVVALHAAQPFALPIHARLPLTDADRAQRLVAAGNLAGRIVLVPGL